MVIDPDTEKGAKVDARLHDELVAWLVTVAADGTPVPTPIWFWWDGESLLVYSQRDKPKLRHIAGNPRVAIAMRTDVEGDDLVVITGEATVDKGAPSADELPGYLESTERRSRGWAPRSRGSLANTQWRSASDPRSCGPGRATLLGA